jgi:hypothetical protein
MEYDRRVLYLRTGVCGTKKFPHIFEDHIIFERMITECNICRKRAYPGTRILTGEVENESNT